MRHCLLDDNHVSITLLNVTLLYHLTLCFTTSLWFWCRFNLGRVGGGTVQNIHYSQRECYQKSLECDFAKPPAGAHSPASADTWSELGTVGGGVVAGKQLDAKGCFQTALEQDISILPPCVFVCLAS